MGENTKEGLRNTLPMDHSASAPTAKIGNSVGTNSAAFPHLTFVKSYFAFTIQWSADFMVTDTKHLDLANVLDSATIEASADLLAFVWCRALNMLVTKQDVASNGTTSFFPFIKPFPCFDMALGVSSSQFQLSSQCDAES